MRTKTLLFSAVLGAAGILSSTAQTPTPVYSVNVVGYVNVTVTNGQFAMIANPLDAPTNTLGALLPSVPDGTQVFRWNGTTYVISTFEEPAPGFGAWTDPSLSLAPGEGVFLKNNAPTNIVVTFVGTVLEGALTTPLPAGYEIRSSKVPQTGRVTTDLLLPAQDGDQVFKWNGGLGTFDIFVFEDPGAGGAWSGPGGEPVINVGESFFVRKNASANWTRSFTVPQ